MIINWDFDKHEVSVKGKVVQLAPLEFKLFKYLIEAQGQVKSRENIIQAVWGYDQPDILESRIVDTCILKLRRKLKTGAIHIKTVPTFGYKFDYRV